MDVRLQRGAQLNLPYDLGKAGLIHFWPNFSNKKPKDPTTQPSVFIDGTEVKASATIKHLGVHLDDSLTFHAHSDDAAAHGNKCLMALATLRHNLCGITIFT